LCGIVQAVGTLWLFHRELARDGSLVLAQTEALTTLALFQLFQLGNARSEHGSLFRSNPFANPFLLTAAVASLLVHVAALYLPWTQLMLHVAPLGPAAWGRIVAVAVTLIAVVEVHKLLRRMPRTA
jgi:Ca2+-transporting ATPase